MTSATRSAAGSGMSPGLKRGIGIGAVVILVIAMALDTTYVKDGTDVSAGSDQFTPESYGQKEFPKARKAISERAAPAPQLARALADDKDGAIKKYGIPGDIAPVLSVKFSGTVDSCDSGICTVQVADMPAGQTVRVQVGPAINGTALRDGVGGVSFGDFKNQIEYQNAAAGINNAMKKAVLADIDRDTLPGKTVNVTGAFQLIIDNNWLVTPVAFQVGS